MCDTIVHAITPPWVSILVNKSSFGNLTLIESVNFKFSLDNVHGIFQGVNLYIAPKLGHCNLVKISLITYAFRSNGLGCMAHVLGS